MRALFWAGHVMKCVILCYCVKLYNMNRRIKQVKVTLAIADSKEGAESTEIER